VAHAYSLQFERLRGPFSQRLAIIKSDNRTALREKPGTRDAAAGRADD
jgi:hypothetical protein